MRGISLEPVALQEEIELTLSSIIEESARTITPPYIQRAALPCGTVIDRNMTRGRGLIASASV